VTDELNVYSNEYLSSIRVKGDFLIRVTPLHGVSKLVMGDVCVLYSPKQQSYNMAQCGINGLLFSSHVYPKNGGTKFH
jgi:hypothetical protein